MDILVARFGWDKKALPLQARRRGAGCVQNHVDYQLKLSEAEQRGSLGQIFPI